MMQPKAALEIPTMITHCRTPDLALNSMRLDRLKNEA